MTVGGDGGFHIGGCGLFIRWLFIGERIGLRAGRGQLIGWLFVGKQSVLRVGCSWFFCRRIIGREIFFCRCIR